MLERSSCNISKCRNERLSPLCMGNPDNIDIINNKQRPYLAFLCLVINRQ